MQIHLNVLLAPWPQNSTILPSCRHYPRLAARRVRRPPSCVPPLAPPRPAPGQPPSPPRLSRPAPPSSHPTPSVLP